MIDAGPPPDVLPSGDASTVVAHVGGVAVIALAGEHDVSTAGALSAAIDVERAAGYGIVVALSDVTFMDSSTVHALCTADRRLMAAGRRLVVHVEQGTIADRVLEVCGLEDALLRGDTLAEAVVFAAQGPDAPPPRD